jgi:hypothetical protein
MIIIRNKAEVEQTCSRHGADTVYLIALQSLIKALFSQIAFLKR